MSVTVAGLLAQLAALDHDRARLSAELAAAFPLANPEAPTVAGAGGFLTPDEAARIARISPRQLAVKTRGEPFRLKLGHKTTVYLEPGLRRWMLKQAA